MAALKSSITKSRSGHYTVSLVSPEFGRLLIVRKIGDIAKARAVLAAAKSDLLTAGAIQVRFGCLYALSITNLNKFVTFLNS